MTLMRGGREGGREGGVTYLNDLEPRVETQRCSFTDGKRSNHQRPVGGDSDRETIGHILLVDRRREGGREGGRERGSEGGGGGE